MPSQNTPFHADGSVDYPAIRRLAAASLGAGVAGMLILAVASENRALSIDERRRIGETFMQEVGGRIPVIVAVSAPYIATAETLTRLAVAIGADAVGYQAPAGITRDALGDQIARICDAGPRLFMLQDLVCRPRPFNRRHCLALRAPPAVSRHQGRNLAGRAENSILNCSAFLPVGCMSRAAGR